MAGCCQPETPIPNWEDSLVEKAHGDGRVRPADGFGDVSLAGNVLGQQHVAGLELKGGTVAHGDLHPAVDDVDDKEVLTPGPVMPIAEAILGGLAEDQIFTRLGGDALDRFCGSVQVLKVGLAVIASVDTDNNDCTSAN